MADLVAAGHQSDPSDVLISLFRAYNTMTNEEFKSIVIFWKNEWNSGQLTSVETLIHKADARYNEFRDMGTWGKRAVKDNQIVALTTKVAELSKEQKPVARKKQMKPLGMKPTCSCQTIRQDTL